jgi:hypothetical protein
MSGTGVARQRETEGPSRRVNQAARALVYSFVNAVSPIIGTA